MTTNGSQGVAQRHAGPKSSHGSATGATKDDPILPLKLHGPEPSYFTGKLEAVIRFMELPYERIAKAPFGGSHSMTGVETSDAGKTHWHPVSRPKRSH